jgi:DNA (cytosine-5)-methyltransferase 1
LIVMTHGSLFSGIGGFDLAAQWMGWENLFHCEWNPFGQKVLKYYWPDAELFTDITKSDFTKYANRIDVLTGGFPCQPYSMAGKRLGKEDDRHLWPEMLRAIREIQPTWVVGENVFGLINWSNGLVFHEVQADLEAAFKDSETYRSLKREGYESFPYVLPACAVNAPHRRDRVWFVAYRDGLRGTQKHELQQSEICQQYGKGWTTPNPDSDGHELRGLREDRPTQGTSEGNQQERERIWDNNRGIGEQGIIADTRLQRQAFGQQQATGIKQCSSWECFPTEPPVCSRNDGLSERLDGITFPKWRNESIKAYGNAVVPQVVYQIFKAIEAYEKLTLVT